MDNRRLDKHFLEYKLLFNYLCIMKTVDINTSLIDNYFGLLKNLSPEVKLDLIERLSRTLRIDFVSDKKVLEKSFGNWVSDKSADDIINDLRNERNFNRQIEEL